MDRATAILLTLIAYKIVLLGIGFLAQRRTRDEADFFLGGRRLGPLVAAISANASSSSVWTLLGVSGYAYLYGLSALWLLPACIGGFALNWFVVAPRLRRHSGDALTVIELFAGPAGRPGRAAIVWLASVIVLASMMTYVAQQFRGAGESFVEIFELDRLTSILIGAAIVVAYTLLGGFLAVSVTDTLQGLMMALAAVLLPVAGLVHVGGPAGLLDGIAGRDMPLWLPGVFQGFRALFESAHGHGPVAALGLTLAHNEVWHQIELVWRPHYLSLCQGMEGAVALGFVFGLLGIGIGYPGQPHAVNRFMALRSEADVGRARLYGMLWALIVYPGMVLVGLCARLSVTMAEGEHERSFYALTDVIFPPIVAGVLIAAVLSAIMSTADSQLLVAGSTVAHDLRAGGTDRARQLRNSRLVVLALSVGAVIAALLVEETIFRHVLFAWSVMGAAFGPLMVVFLLRGPVSVGATLGAMGSGAVLSALAFYTEWGKDVLGPDVDERIVPWVVAFAIAWLGSNRRGVS